jgi:hypothetical protein
VCGRRLRSRSGRSAAPCAAPTSRRSRFRVESVAWNRLALRDIRLGAGEVVAQGAELGFGWDDFVAGRAGSAIVRGLRVSARRSESGWSLGSLDPWLARVLASRGGSRAAAPLRRLAIEDGAIAIDTPAGSAHANLTADLGSARRSPVRSRSTGSCPTRLPATRAERSTRRARSARAPSSRSIARRWRCSLPSSPSAGRRVAAIARGDRRARGDAIELAVALDAQLADPRAPSRTRRATGPVRLRSQPGLALVTLVRAWNSRCRPDRCSRPRDSSARARSACARATARRSA